MSEKEKSKTTEDVMAPLFTKMMAVRDAIVKQPVQIPITAEGQLALSEWVRQASGNLHVFNARLFMFEILLKQIMPKLPVLYLCL